MKLLTKEITDKLPALYSQEHVEDPICNLKFFTPDADWTWFMTEGEPINFRCNNCRNMQERKGDGCEQCQSHDLEQVGKNWLFYGCVVNPMCPDGEWGYTTLEQLQEVRGRMGLPVERDMYWKPKPISKCLR